MRLIVTNSPAEVGRIAALLIKQRIEVLRRQHQTIGLRLATGGTPQPLYQELLRSHRRDGFSFSDIWFSSLDAYIGPKRGELGSYPDELWTDFLQGVDCNPFQVRLTDAPTENPDELLAIIARLETELREPARREIAVYGIGHDTHIAFIQPCNRRGRLRVRGFGVEQLSDLTREKNARFFSGMKNLVPTRALTILGGSILEMDMNILMAFGADKAEAIYNLWAQPVSEQYPATILRESKRAIVVVDQQAASLVKPLLHAQSQANSS